MNLSESTIKIFLSKAGGAVVFFLGITVFARELGASQIGTFFLFQTALGLISIVADVGIRGALEKRLSEGSAPEEMLGSAISLKVVFLALASIGLLLARGSIDHYVGGMFSIYLLVTLICREFADVFIQTLRGELRVGETAVIEFVRYFAWFVVGYLLVAAGGGVLGLIYGLIAGELVALVWALLRVETSIGRPAWSYISSLFGYAKHYAITSIGIQIYSWMDVAIIGLFLTTADVGRYEVAWQVTLLVLLGSNAMARVLFPQVSQWSAAHATERIERTVSMAIGIALFISVPALFGAMVFAREILVFVFGPEYGVVWLVLVVLMVEKVVQSVNDILGNTLLAVNRQYLATRAMVVTIVVNVVLNVVLVLTIGLVGAAIATTVAATVHTLFHVYYLSTVLTLRMPYHLVIGCTVASVLMTGVLTVARSVVPVYDAVGLFAYVLLGIVVYVCATALIPTLREEIFRPGIELLS